MNEVLRGGPGYRPQVVGHFAKVADVFLLRRGPESDVLRVESPVAAGVRLAHHRLVAQLPPMDAVGGSEGQQGQVEIAKRLAIRQGLIALVRGYAGSAVEQRREIVAGWGHARQDHVVLFRAGDLVQPQFRLGPMNAVDRFGIAGDFGVGSILANPLGAAAVVHPQLVAVANDGGVGAEDSFPGCIELEHLLPLAGLAELDRALPANGRPAASRQTARGGNPRKWARPWPKPRRPRAIAAPAKNRPDNRATSASQNSWRPTGLRPAGRKRKTRAASLGD